MDFKKRALERLKGLEQSLSNVLVIHYSCESLADKKEGYSPRVSAICIRNVDSGQTYSFSIYRLAEIKSIARDEIESHYDVLEREMLGGFFDFVADHKAHTFAHWNMRDENYGFQALYHRYRVLDGEPKVIDETRLVDLARVLVDIYGPRYVNHPRLQNLISLNGISSRNYMTGAEEADAFAKKEYIKLHQSTLSKVDCINHILILQLTGKLKVSIGRIPMKVRDVHEHWAFKALLIGLALWGFLSAAAAGGAFVFSRFPHIP